MKTRNKADQTTSTKASGLQRPREKGQRDREQTRKEILSAMGRILARKGSAGLGVNAIAREAQVDKVLIYRYFGSLGELYRAFAVEGGSFPDLDEISEGRKSELASLPAAELAKLLIIGFGRAIRRRPITKEMMRWEMQERNELTEELTKERERQSMQWLGFAPDDLDGADIAAVTSILVAGQVYLTLRAKTTDTYNGIALNTDQGWKRLEDAVTLLCDLFFKNAAKDARSANASKRRAASKSGQS